MSNENKKNIHYFESLSMNELFNSMQSWQNESNKRLLSMSIEKDCDKFCCIALTNPSEVVITSMDGKNSASVDEHGRLDVWTYET